jgi:predicted secreted protein
MAQRADILISVGGEAIGYLRGARIETRVRMIDAAAESVYGFSRRIAAGASWSASGTVFVPMARDAGQSAILDAMLARESVAVVADQDGDTDTGTAIVTDWSISGSIGGAVEGSFSLQGIGGLT